MTTTLLRYFNPLPWLVLLLVLLGGIRPAQASHLLGGEMTYRYLNANGPAAAPHRYEITVIIYNTCGAAAIRPAAVVGIYNQATGAQVNLTATNYATLNNGSMSIPQTSIDACTTPPVPPGCTITGNSQSYQLQKFVGTVNLPASTAGYYALWTDFTRNLGITNIQSPSDAQNMTLYSTLAPPSRPNSSPVFVEKAVANLCINDTTYILNNAVDADGDRLEYSFAQPYGNVSSVPPLSFLPAPDPVPYAGLQYSAATPLGTTAGNYARINATTGIAKYRTTAGLGSLFVVAIDVKEYRTIGGQQVLIGVTRRDMQLVVVSCPNTVAPIHPTSALVAPTPRTFTMEAGSTLTVPLTATQAAGHPLTMSLSSVLLDGAGGYNATFNGQPGTLAPGNPAGSATMSSPGSPATGTFVFAAGCNDARATPYDVTVIVKDDACAGKTVGDVLRITVVRPTGPTAIAGPLSVCGLNTVQTYTASGGTAPTVQWTVTGGTIVGSPTANPVTVSWPTAGAGTVKAQGVTQYGCLVEQVTKNVTISPAVTLALTGSQTICQGGSTTLAVSGGTAPYTITGGAAPLTGAGPFLLSPSQTTTYTVTGTASSGCPATGLVTITVNAPAVANAGAAVALCPGGSASLGTPAVAGNSYSWSPTTGLSSATAATPTVTLGNATGAPLTQTYTLTATNVATGCQATSTVVVTVNPLPVANAGAAVAICAGGTGQLGAPAVAGNRYSWSPTTGLSSATSANPTVTLPNTTSAPITQNYTLTVTSATGCTSTRTVVVTVNPLPVANVGAAVAICAGGVGQLGASAVAGTTYSWSPTTGLSNAASANPTVTLPNATGAPITQNYTLTVTNAAGCVSTSTVSVTVNPLPVAAAGAAVSFCAGGSATLGAVPVAGYTYSWSPTTGLSSATSANPTVTLPNASGAPVIRTYTLTVTSALGCTSTSTVAVTVNPLPVASAGAAVSFCAGGSATLGAAPVAGYTYSWSPTTGLSSATSANPTVTLPNSTAAVVSQTYTLTVTSAAGCTSTGTVVVTVNPLPVATAGAALINCAGGTGQLGAAPVAGYTYSWSPTTGLSNVGAANPTVSLPNATGAPIVQTYTLTVTSATGCTSTGTVAVTVQPVVTPGAIGADQTVCAGAVPAPLSNLAAATGSNGTYTYHWESSPDNITWTGIGSVNTLTYAPGPVAATTYFRRRVTAGDCGAAYSNVVKVTTQPLLVPAVALPVQPAQCAGLPFTFTPTPTNAGNAPTYQWFVNGTAVSTGPTYTSSTLADGDVVRVVMTPTVGFCASGPAIATVRVALTPVLITSVVISTSTALPVCPGAPIVFGLDAAHNVGTSPQYQWQVDGVPVAGATGASFTSTTLRNGQRVTLAIRSTNACGQPATATSNAVPVLINPPVQISAGPDKTITVGESVVLEGTADGSYPVVWAPASTLTFSSGNQLRPVAAPLVTTTYTLTAGSGYCGSRSTVTVTVLPHVRIPNAFSPNGDNDDDTWQIDNIEAYPSSRVIVFNRWGAKIFETSNYTRGSEWNGTMNGQPAPFGTYYYIITLGTGKSYTGPITIVK